jgi:hypothetical protein
MKPGDYVYDEDANLCYIDEEYVLHSYGIESWKGKDAIVYPITLETNEIMAKMRKLRRKYHDTNIMNSTFSRELEQGLFELMKIDVQDRAYSSKMDKVWAKLERRYNELVEHAKALCIYRDPYEKEKWEAEHSKCVEEIDLEI